MSSKRLTGKRILVTGGGGIGNVLALRYAREGASVLLADRDRGVADEAVRAFNPAGRGA